MIVFGMIYLWQFLLLRDDAGLWDTNSFLAKINSIVNEYQVEENEKIIRRIQECVCLMDNLIILIASLVCIGILYWNIRLESSFNLYEWKFKSN